MLIDLFPVEKLVESFCNRNDNSIDYNRITFGNQKGISNLDLMPDCPKQYIFTKVSPKKILEANLHIRYHHTKLRFLL